LTLKDCASIENGVTPNTARTSMTSRRHTGMRAPGCRIVQLQA